MTAVLLVQLALAVLTGCSKQGELLHLVVISIDTLRADHLASYGHPFIQTPRIDRLAAEGFRFENHMSAAPTTLVSHTSLMTGTWPHTHGVPRNGFVVAADNTLLAEILTERGFTAAGFIGAFPLLERFAFNQGFDHWDEAMSSSYQGKRRQGRTLETDHNQRSANEVTDAVIQWLDENVDYSRLFLFVHYFDVHAPYLQPGRFGQMYRDPDAQVEGSIASIRKARRQLTAHTTTGLQKRLAQSYAAGVSWVDFEIGRLIDDLADRGILENAIVVITSDHGETSDQGWEHWTHGFSVSQATIHTPLIIRMPRGFAGGESISQLVSNVDVVPSLLELFDLPIPKSVEGISFAKLLMGNDSAHPGVAAEVRELAFSEATKPYDVENETSTAWENGRKCRAARTQEWKLVDCPLRETLELFHIASDPDERDNVADENPEKVAELHKRLSEWGAEYRSARPTSRHLDPETRTRLEALGYVGEAPAAPVD